MAMYYLKTIVTIEELLRLDPKPCMTYFGKSMMSSVLGVGTRKNHTKRLSC